MSNGWQRLPGTLVVILLLMMGGIALSSCKKKDKMPEVSNDPRPGELVEDLIREDSILKEQKVVVKDTMEKLLASYNKKYTNAAQTGYFTTDLDHDRMPELWIKNTDPVGDPRIELYFPMRDGSLKQSEIEARNGQFYMGEDFVVFVMRGEPGKILIKELTIVNGNLESHVMRELDLSKDPTQRNFKVDLPEIRTVALSNTGPLKEAFDREPSSVDIGVSGVSLNEFFTGSHFLAHKH